ncbi:hypothetical protein ACFXJ8_26120 [Nonomuraea sp. NPDC059194]|uniref:hypothetical protein n=1 Tax=Nonomuraea sp. NPDC059194 TaxID=3346764 RepID=UPI00368FA9A4
MTHAELIEKHLREHLRLRLGKRALTDAMLDKPIMLSGGEAEEAARIALDALAEAGMVVSVDDRQICHEGYGRSATHDLRQRFAEALLLHLPPGPAVAEALDDLTRIRDEELERLRAKVAEYENTITWGTSCTACARLLGECRRQEERAAKAERESEQRRLAYNAAKAMAGVHKRRADRLKTELEHAKAALAGDSEGVAAFMADHAKVVERHRERADMWQREAEKAEADIDRVRAVIKEWHAEAMKLNAPSNPDRAQQAIWATVGHVCALALGALDDTLEPDRG